MPGITITGRLPLLARAVAKMCSRFGVLRAEMQPVVMTESIRTPKMRCGLFVEFVKNRRVKRFTLFNGRLPATVYQTRDKARSEAVVDIDHGHIRCARVQHAEQCRYPTKGCAVSDTGWYSHHRNAYQTTDHRRQRTFHSRRDDHNARALQQVSLG